MTDTWTTLYGWLVLLLLPLLLGPILLLLPSRYSASPMNGLSASRLHKESLGSWGGDRGFLVTGALPTGHAIIMDASPGLCGKASARVVSISIHGMRGIWWERFFGGHFVSKSPLWKENCDTLALYSAVMYYRPPILNDNPSNRSIHPPSTP